MSANQITYKLLRRKPSVWAVEHDGRTGTVAKGPHDAAPSKRWKLDGDAGAHFFKSRRAAFHFFRTGEKFTVKPVYAVIGGRRSQKRVR